MIARNSCLTSRLAPSSIYWIRVLQKYGRNFAAGAGLLIIIDKKPLKDVSFSIPLDSVFIDIHHGLKARSR
jgi:hypothetical protein